MTTRSRDPDTARPCLACAGTAEPEQDGDLTYWECGGCGYAFGFRHRTPNDDGTCSVGVPEDIRRAASAPAHAALADAQPGPLLTIGVRRDPTAT